MNQLPQDSRDFQLTQLKTALLQLHENRVRSRGMQRGKKINRWTVLWSLLRLLPPFRKSHTYPSQEKARRLYQKLSGKDLFAALIDINVMERQLSLLDDLRAAHEKVGPQRRHLISAHELELIADALIGYHLRDQKDDDELLRQTQNAFQALSLATDKRRELIESGHASRDSRTAAVTEEEEALSRYYALWDQWFELHRN